MPVPPTVTLYFLADLYQCLQNCLYCRDKKQTLKTCALFYAKRKNSRYRWSLRYFGLDISFCDLHESEIGSFKRIAHIKRTPGVTAHQIYG